MTNTLPSQIPTVDFVGVNVGNIGELLVNGMLECASGNISINTNGQINIASTGDHCLNVNNESATIDMDGSAAFKSVILQSPNGNRGRVTLGNDMKLVVTPIP